VSVRPVAETMFENTHTGTFIHGNHSAMFANRIPTFRFRNGQSHAAAFLEWDFRQLNIVKHS
jgi:hypothetical protein